MRQLFSWPEAMAKIREIQPYEEHRYTDLPDAWDGWIAACTEHAMLFVIRYLPSRFPNDECWVPLSQIRKAEDEQSIYFSTWICDRLGI